MEVEFRIWVSIYKVIIRSGNGFSPGLTFGPLGINLSEHLIKIRKLSFRTPHLNVRLVNAGLSLPQWVKSNHHERSVVPEAGINSRGKYLHPAVYAGCNCLSPPLIPAANPTLLIKHSLTSCQSKMQWNTLNPRKYVHDLRFVILPCGSSCPGASWVTWKTASKRIQPQQINGRATKFSISLEKWLFNSLRPSANYMRQYTRASSIQIMSCSLFGAKSLSKPGGTFCDIVQVPSGADDMQLI